MTLKPIATYFNSFLAEYKDIEGFLKDSTIDDTKQLVAEIDIKEILYNQFLTRHKEIKRLETVTIL